MIACALMLLLMSSGSIAGSVIGKKRFEDVLPVTCMTAVLILFLFGLAGQLKTGLYCVYILAAILLFISLIYLLKKNQRTAWKDAGKWLFTPAFFLFTAGSVLLIYIDYNMMVHNWDEFSHWADIVKAMVTLDDFGTNPNSHSTYITYPPAMSLFQYLTEKMYLSTTENNTQFVDWLLYWGYQVFCFSVILPHFRRFQSNKPVLLILCAVATGVLILFFYNDFYQCIYIDPSLGIFSGAGFAAVLGWKQNEKNKLYSLYILMLCSSLVLLKDSGLLFSVILALIFVLDHNGWKNRIISTIYATAAVFLPRVLWNHEVGKSPGINFTGGSLKYILAGRNTDYGEVSHEFLDALLHRGISFGHSFLYVYIPYMVLLAIETLILFVLVYRIQKKENQTAKRTAILCVLSCLQVLLYIIGILFVYLYNFTAYEANRLASFERYINTAFLSLAMCDLLLALYMISNDKKSEKRIAVVFGILIIMSPFTPIQTALTRSTVKGSIAMRAQYDSLTELIQENCSGEDAVYVISQESNGFDKWVLKYSIRPNHTNSGFTWSLGEPFYEGDIWTEQISPKEWQEELKNGYDYVALFRLNTYFYDTYSEVFDSLETVAENCLYKVDKNTGKLIRVN